MSEIEEHEIQDFLDMYDEGEKNDLLQDAFDRMIMHNEPLEEVLVDVTQRIHDKTIDDITRDKRGIVLIIEADKAKYETLEAMIGVSEFIIYLARRACDRNEITEMEYIQFRQLFKQIGFPHIGLTKYPNDLGSNIAEIDEAAIQKEIARRRLLELLADNDEAMTLISTLDLDRPIIASIDDALDDQVTHRGFMNLLDEYCRFGVLCTEGISNIGKVMKFIMEHIGMLPKLNGGYALLSALTRSDDETPEEFNTRCDSEARHASVYIAETLGDCPEAYRFIIMQTHFGQLNITGMAPDYETHVLDQRPKVQGLMSNIRMTGQSQIE